MPAKLTLTVDNLVVDAAKQYAKRCGTSVSWKADVIVTRDKKGFKRAELPVLNAQELIVYLNGL